MLAQKSIGGFFELEETEGGCTYHSSALALTSGRACFGVIVDILKPSKVFVPYYICETALAPLIENEIDYCFYAIDKDFFPLHLPILQENEYILFVNYFGLVKAILDQLYTIYGNKIIIDNTQAFFEKEYADCYSFNSARKFFGVADGAYAYGENLNQLHFPANQAIKTNHLMSRRLGKESAYAEFLENEAEITTEKLVVSSFSREILNKLDYSGAIQKRRHNYKVYAELFSSLNLLQPVFNDASIPFCYPLLLDKKIDKTQLFSQRIFIATYWPHVIERSKAGFKFEKLLTENLLPLPIDHRYTPTDCQYVAKIIKELI